MINSNTRLHLEASKEGVSEKENHIAQKQILAIDWSFSHNMASLGIFSHRIRGVKG